MLLEVKRPADALKEFEASQVREPERFRGYYGAAQAAAQAGDNAKARGYYAKLVAMADPARRARRWRRRAPSSPPIPERERLLVQAVLLAHSRHALRTKALA